MITGDSKWVEITALADPLYQHLIVTADKVLALCRERGAAHDCLGSSRPSHGSRRSALSTWARRIPRRNSLLPLLADPFGPSRT